MQAVKANSVDTVHTGMNKKKSMASDTTGIKWMHKSIVSGNEKPFGSFTNLSRKKILKGQYTSKTTISNTKSMAWITFLAWKSGSDSVKWAINPNKKTKSEYTKERFVKNCQCPAPFKWSGNPLVVTWDNP